jgi:hypothetical protein
MTEKECREQPKPDWWNAENWKNEDGTEMTSMEMEAWTQPKNPECKRYYTDLLIKAQNDGKKFWCREVQVKALVATIDWFSGLTSSSSAARWKHEKQTGCFSPSDVASCSNSHYFNIFDDNSKATWFRFEVKLQSKPIAPIAI